MAKARGRPSTYTPELAEKICTLIASGSNLNVLCRTYDWMPAERAVYKWLKDPKYSDFVQEYSRARQVRADWRSDKIDDITRDLLDGKIEPEVARVAISAHMKQAGYEKPSYYGNKTETHHTGNINVTTIVADMLKDISGNTTDLPIHDIKLIEETTEDGQ